MWRFRPRCERTWGVVIPLSHQEVSASGRQAAVDGRMTPDLRPIPSANASRGCSIKRLPQTWPTIVSGGTTDLYLPTLRRPFRLALPKSYGSNRAEPGALLLYFHGWGGTLNSGKAFHDHAVATGDHLVAAPLGFDDEGTQFTSWNGGGTIGSSSSHRRCHDPKGSFANLCYSRSCGICNDTCWWTTCEDSVAQVARLLEELDSALCFDPRRVYVTGESNGGIFLYELAASYLATSFAAYMPIVGSPHRDFAAHFPLGGPVAFFGIWGRNDATIPPIANPSVVGHPGDKDVALDTQWKGYYFRTADATAVAWARENRCANASQSPLLNTSSAGTSISGARDGCGDSEACRIAMSASSGWGAACKGWAAETCEGSAAVLLCLHPRGHETPPWAPAAVVAFMREHNRQEARSAGSGNRVVMEGNGSVLADAQPNSSALVVVQHVIGDHGAAAAFSVAVPAFLFLAGCAALYYLRRRRRRMVHSKRRGVELQLPVELAVAPPDTVDPTD